MILKMDKTEHGWILEGEKLPGMDGEAVKHYRQEGYCAKRTLEDAIEEAEPYLEEQIIAAGIRVIGKDIFPRAGEFRLILLLKDFQGPNPKQLASSSGIRYTQIKCFKTNCKRLRILGETVYV